MSRTHLFANGRLHRALTGSGAALGLLLALGGNAQAQDTATWEQLNGTLNLHPEQPGGFRLNLDLHARRMEGKFLGIVRPGVAFDVLPWLSLWAGYSYVPLLQTPKDHAQQDLWQQVLVGSKFSGFDASLRTRIEERWDGKVDGTSLRLRFMGRLAHDLNDSMFAVVWDEALMTLNDTDWVPGGVNENRLFVGPGWHLGANRVEVGYMNSHLFANGPVASATNHIVMTSVFVGF
jgi:hypothetical protein